MFSVRIVTANHYLAKPIRDLDVAYSDFRGAEVRQVPVLRIFGATPVGQKTCLHIHGVFPYIYVGCGPHEFITDKDLRHFATSLDLALHVAMGNASSNTHHVFKVVSVQAVPMYGYHSRSRRFLKVYFYNPLMVKRAVELLQSGAVLNNVFQPHEAHIPFIMQFFIDYNLYGMNLIHLAAVKFRRQNDTDDVDTENSSPDTQPINLSSMLSGSTINSHRWNKDSIPSGLLLDAEIKKQSVCELEVDAVAVDILNRHELQGNNEMSPGLLAIYNEEKERREVKGQLDDLHPPSSPGRGVIDDAQSEVMGKARLADIIQKQLDELRELAGEGEDGEEDDNSLLQDTLASPSLTASQLILHETQHEGEEDSPGQSEEESQPVINEELVQSLVEASQRSSQYSQQPDGEDDDLARLLMGLAQDGASPEDGSILGSQTLQDEERNTQDGEIDEDARESQEMSQVWQDDSEEDSEETVKKSHTTHDISASEEDTQEGQAISIPQFDGGSDDKPAPVRKKTLGMKTLGVKRQLPGLFPTSPAPNSTSFSPFPPEIKTYSNKKLFMRSPEKAKGPSLAPQKFKKQTAVLKTDKNMMRKKLKLPTREKMTSGLHKNPRQQTGVTSATLPNTLLQTLSSRGTLPVGPAANKGPQKRNSLDGQDVFSFGRNESETVSRVKMDSGKGHSSVSKTKSPVSKTKSPVSHPDSHPDLTLLKRHSKEQVPCESPPKNAARELVSDKASFNRNLGLVSLHQVESSAPDLVRVPSASNAVRFAGCPELQKCASLEDLKKNPSWNPFVMLIKCPIVTDARGKIRFSGTSLPQKQLERIRRDNLKALPFRRSSFARKIVPPRKFMDEQYWMDQIIKLSKKKSLEEPNVRIDDTSDEKSDPVLVPKKRGRPPKIRTHTSSAPRDWEGSQKPVENPPCVFSQGHFDAVTDKGFMPVLKNQVSSSTVSPQHVEKPKTFTKTKAVLQEKYYKSLSLSDKKNKLSRRKPHSCKDTKRCRLLSKTFNRLSLSAEESSEGEAFVEASQPSLDASTSPNIPKTSFVSPVSTCSRIDSSEVYSESQVSSVPVQNIFSPSSYSSIPTISLDESPQVIKRRNSSSKKRRGSDSSDEWAVQTSPNLKRKISQNSLAQELLFGKSYRFRKRERISYDDGDFPDVGFDIMCGSDQDDHSDGFASKDAHQQQLHQWHRANLEPEEVRLKSHPENSSANHGSFAASSPPRKRGRPFGSKNKPKPGKLPSPNAGKSKGSPSSRSKPHLSFTVDSMLHTGAKQSMSQIKPVPVGSLKPLLITVTSCSTVGGPLTSRPLQTQARTGQPTVNHSTASKSTSGWHKPFVRTQPVSTPVNGHHSISQEESSEPVLYRDAMWNLGYFSPRRKEKQGSPPRCWSPSNEVETSRQTLELDVDIKQNRNFSVVPKSGERLRNSEPKQGHKKKAIPDNITWSRNGDRQSHNGTTQEGITTNHKQLMTNFNSRDRDLEAKHLCNTETLKEGGLLKTSTFDKNPECKQEPGIQKEDEKDSQKKEDASLQEEEFETKRSLHEIAAKDISLDDNPPHGHSGLLPEKTARLQKTAIDQESPESPDLLNISSGKSSGDETSTIKTSLCLEGKAGVDSAPKNVEEDNEEHSTGSGLPDQLDKMETSDPAMPSQESKHQTPNSHDLTDHQGLDPEVKAQSHTTDVGKDGVIPRASSGSQSSVERHNGMASVDDTESSMGRHFEGSRTSSSDIERESSSSSPPESPQSLHIVSPSDDENQNSHSDPGANPPVDVDPQMSDPDDTFSPRSPDDEHVSQLESLLRRQSQSRTAPDKRASPYDLNGSCCSSSGDITPGQRKRKSLSEEEREEDKEDSTSQASSSSVASLSLDMSLIISHVPAISPTGDATELQGNTFSREEIQNRHELHREEMIQVHQKSRHQATDHFASSPSSPEVLDLTCKTGRGWPLSDQEQTGERSHTPVTSGNHKSSVNCSSSDEADQTLESKMSASSAESDGNSLSSQGDKRIKHGSRSMYSDDSDTYSQLVCPETPSPSNTDNQRTTNVESLSQNFSQKADSQVRPVSTRRQPQDNSKTPGGNLERKIQFLSNKKTQELLSTKTSESVNADHAAQIVSLSEAGDLPGNLSLTSKQESAVASDGRGSPYRKDAVSSDEEVEAMVIDSTEDEGNTNQDVTRCIPSSQEEGSLSESHPRGNQENLKALEESDDHLARQTTNQDEAFAPDNQESQFPPIATQTTESLPHCPESSAKSRSSPLSSDMNSNQAAEALNEATQPREPHQSHPLEGEKDTKEARNQTPPISGNVSLQSPDQPQSPAASSQGPLQHTASAFRVETESSEGMKVWTPKQSPPSADMVRASLQEFGLPDLHHQRVFCGNPNDVQKSSKPGVHQDGQLQSNLPSHLPEAESRLSQTGLGQWQANLMALKPHPLLSPSNVAPERALKAALLDDACAVITPSKSPPRVKHVQDWLNIKNRTESLDKQDDKKVKVDNINKPEETKQPTDQPSTSKNKSEGGTKMQTVSKSEAGTEPALSSPRLTPEMMLSFSKSKTPRVILHRCKINSFSSSKPQDSSAVVRNEDSPQSMPGTPRIHPLSERGDSQPQHSTPMRFETQGDKGGIPLTPISGWKRPAEPSSSGESSKRETSFSSMRQTVLFTPTEAEGGRRREMSQIEGATPSNTCGFKMPQFNMQEAKAVHEVQHLTVMSLELHVKTRRDYHPDPDFDPIRALFYSIQHDTPPRTDQASSSHHPQEEGTIHGVIIVEEGDHSNPGPSTSSCPQSSLAHSGICNIQTTSVANENDLINELLSIVRKHDPDILVGYEVQQNSWGYLLERAAFLDVDLCSQISRLPEFKKESSFSSERDAYGADHQSEISIAGRITLNLWRLMRHEVALTNYTFENVAFHVLHQRIPQFTYRKLTDWFDHRHAQIYRWRVIEYYSVRVRGSLKLLQQLDLIGRTSELARVFGIQFYSVLSRGSQFRVESMMLRTAKPQNYVAMSPSVQQRARMKAPECIPLVMEPESRFYQDPVIVLDFQSLYPTMMIAYNYCYSTCLGRLEHIANGGEYVLGCGSLSVSSSQLKKLLQSDSLHVSPNGIVFVKPSVRRGVLPTMLEQILKLRLIVKKALKDFKDDKTLHRMLDSRQLALKLIANVTYGYTSANFSGRMPCIEVGDSVVRKGRETLEAAIHMVENTKKWGARVVYGDTDSMFVLVEGASKKRAFEVGREIRDAVTAANPKPVKLKLEKVYHPCVLQSKKRYVGYSYESPDQEEPDFDAKGIETVRRDSCPAVGKILERALKILFTTRDVSRVKQYVQTQFHKILDGKATMQDLIFAKEYRGSHTYRPGACVPALEISRRLLAVDRRAEPRVGQRVPYVIVHGHPGLPLIQLVRTPNQVLQDPSLRLNTTYYLTRQLVPSLNRVFGLLGVDTMQWYQELPKSNRITARHQPGTPGKKGTISQYFASLNCVICEKVTKDSLCDECRVKGQVTSTALLCRIQQWQLIEQDMAKICRSCCNFSEQGTNSCVSLDCPVMFKTNKLTRQLGQVPQYLQLLDAL